jgi:hypothetical protein
MASERSGSSSQRRITTFYPLESVNTNRRRAASHSVMRCSTSRSTALGISRPSTSRGLSRPSTSRSDSRPSAGRSGTMPVTRQSTSRLTNSRSTIRPSRSTSRPSTSRSTPRPSTSRSTPRPSTSRSTTRPSISRSTNKQVNSRDCSNNARSRTGLVNSSLSTTHSNTRLRNNESSTRPRTSQSNTLPRTQGKTALSTLGTSNDQQIICAISESRGISPVVGLAFVNLTTSEAVLCQISDNQTYTRTIHKLWVFDPSEILFMNTAANPNSQLYSAVGTHQPRLLPHARVIAIDRKYWSETSGQEYIQTLAFRQDVEAIKVSLGGNFYATCCFAAVCFRRLPFFFFILKFFPGAQIH